MDNAIGNTRSYLDFEGLGQLKGQARQDAKSATRETAQQFEAMFIQMMMKSMRESVMKSELSENAPLDTYQSLADMLVKNLEQMEAAKLSTAEILKMREEGGLPAAKPIPLNPKETSIPLNTDSRSGFKLPKNGAIPLNMMPNLGKNFDRNSL